MLVPVHLHYQLNAVLWRRDTYLLSCVQRIYSISENWAGGRALLLARVTWSERVTACILAYSYPQWLTFCLQILNKLKLYADYYPIRDGFKPGSHNYATNLPGTWPLLGQRCGIHVCEHLSPTHNLSQALIAGFPASQWWIPGIDYVSAINVHIYHKSQVGQRHMRIKLYMSQVRHELL